MRLKDELSNNLSLRASVTDGIAYAIMFGMADNYFSAFGIFLQASAMQIAVLAALPPLVGAISQIIGLFVTEGSDSRRKIMVRGAYWQAASLLPIALIAIFNIHFNAVDVLIIGVCIYCVALGLTVPPWSSLMGDILKPDTRAQFFGYRSARIQIFMFVATIGAGLLLHQFDIHGRAAYGFFVIMFVAAIARTISARALSLHDDPIYQHQPNDEFSFLDFVRSYRNSNFAHFVLFFSTVNFGTAIAGPFFALYMLNTLSMSYMTYTILIGAPVVAQFLLLPYWALFIDSLGPKWVLKVTGYGVALIPLLWLFSANYYYLGIIQAYSGMMWAGFNLASQTFLYETVTPPKRARCTAYQSVVNGIFVFAGTALGGYLLKNMDVSILVRNSYYSLTSPILILFLISGLIRGGAAVFMQGSFKEVKKIPRHLSFWRVVKMSLSAGVRRLAFIKRLERLGEKEKE